MSVMTLVSAVERQTALAPPPPPPPPPLQPKQPNHPPPAHHYQQQTNHPPAAHLYQQQTEIGSGRPRLAVSKAARASEPWWESEIGHVVKRDGACWEADSEAPSSSQSQQQKIKYNKRCMISGTKDI